MAAATRAWPVSTTPALVAINCFHVPVLGGRRESIYTTTCTTTTLYTKLLGHTSKCPPPAAMSRGAKVLSDGLREVTTAAFAQEAS